MGETKLLVDAGISARRIKNSLAEIGVAIEELQGILITHEHRDHINGLVTLTKKYQLPIYSRANTFRQMYCRDLLADRCCNAIVDCLAIGDIRIESFSISHDAADPVGYSLYRQGLKCTVATDLGFVTTGVQKALEDVYKRQAQNMRRKVFFCAYFVCSIKDVYKRQVYRMLQME